MYISFKNHSKLFRKNNAAHCQHHKRLNEYRTDGHPTVLSGECSGQCWYFALWSVSWSPTVPSATEGINTVHNKSPELIFQNLCLYFLLYGHNSYSRNTCINQQHTVHWVSCSHTYTNYPFTVTRECFIN